MKKFLGLFLLLFALCPVFVKGFDTSAIIAEMKQSGQTLVWGTSEETGIYIICAETVKIENENVSLAQETAKMQARVSIAEYLKTKISHSESENAVTKSSVESSVSRTGTDAHVTQNTRSRYSSQKDVNELTNISADQVQRALSVCYIEKNGDALTVYCLAMTRISDAVLQMNAAMKRLGPNTVQVSGVGYFGNGISEGQAAQNAVLEAQREAIAQVLGVSMVSESYRQRISFSSIDATDKSAQSHFACDDTFKAKMFSSAAGFVESSRIVDKKVVPPTVIVTIVATVAKDKLMSDYRSYLESMGNPGFAVRSNDRDLLELYSGFFAGLGCRMVDNLYDAAYVIDVICKFMESGSGIQAAIRVVARDKVNQTTIFSMENDPEEFSASANTQSAKIALCRRHLNKMKPRMHEALNTFIGRANADGRKITVTLKRYDSGYKEVLPVIFKALKMVPGASNVKQQVSGRQVTYSLNYKGETEDLAGFLEKQIETDIQYDTDRPKRGRISNTNVVFNFE